VAGPLSRARLSALSLSADRAAALRYAAVVLVGTRLALWLVALFAEATTQPRHNPGADAWDDPSLTQALPEPWRAIFGVWARWDAVWFLRIAEDGYHARPGAPAFFPLYPLLERVLGTAVGGPLVAGVLISLGASLAVFYLLHRLAEHELGRPAARRAVLYLAVCPMALFLAAAYSEALFLALALASVWAARRGAFAAAGAWGGLAAATRSAGLLLLIPLAIMWIERARRPAEDGGPRRLRLSWSALWLALVPAGTAAFGVYLWLAGLGPLAPLRAQGDVWDRRTVTPFQGLWDALSAGWAGVRQLAAGADGVVYWTRSTGEPIRVAALNLSLLAALVALALGVALCFRALPHAYGWYALASLLLPLSTPGHALPLLSLPRFGLVMFPVFMALAAWAARRPGVNTAVLVAFPLLLGLFTAQWATWQWVS
jgi:mannosyltransferase PIG-V